MATNIESTQIPITYGAFNGGLNSTSGPLGVQDNEASDLQNVEFSKFGSILERKGYTVLNATPVTSVGLGQGLYWYNGLSNRYPVMVSQGKIYKMDDLDGNWDDITGSVTFGGGADTYTKLLLHCDGTLQDVTFTDASSGAKAVTNTATYDSYTTLLLHCEGTDASTAFTDSSATVHTMTSLSTVEIDTSTYKLGSASALFVLGVGIDTYTNLLLHFDGTNGSTTFSDCSLAAHTGIIASGSAQVAIAQQVFGTGSLLLSTTAFVNVPHDDDWAFGTGSFTIDCRVRFSSLSTTQFIVGQGNDSLNYWVIYWSSDNTVSFLKYTDGTETITVTYSWTPTVNTWYHLALVRSGTNFKFYVEGVSLGTAVENTYSITDFTKDLIIGARPHDQTYGFDGYIDELRISKGIARWTANFTPPTTAYFPSGYLYTPDHADFNFADGDFTIDFWINTDTDDLSLGTQGIIGQYADSNDYWFIHTTSGNILTSFKRNNVASGYYTAAGPFTANTWHHIALVRDNANPYIFVDGTSQTLVSTSAFTTKDVTVTGANLTIGMATVADTNFYFKGWIDELRISKGIARWIANFTPPTCPYGQVGISTTNNKFGTGGAELKGFERLTCADHADFNFGTGTFTIDLWAKFSNLTNAAVFMGQYEDSSNYWYLKKDTNANGNKLSMVFLDTGAAAGSYVMDANWGVTAGQWYHLAFIRDTAGVKGKIYINGTNQSLTETTAFASNDVTDTAAILTIGYQNNASFFDGWLDEVRVSKGIVRWSSNFTPPTEKYGSYLHEDFDTFGNYVLGTDMETVPWQWTESNTTASSMAVVSGLTGAKLIKKFQNYCFVANVRISGVRYPSRFYWSNIKDITTWDSADFVDVSKDDGDEITGMRVLGDRLIIYKNNSIYIVTFTGDADIPFVMQKSNSAVGCSSPYSIQDVENGHVFASYDGVYFFDGLNSYKASDRINDTYLGLNNNELDNAVSLYQKSKNTYWLACASGTSLTNDFVLSWNSYLNAWSKYVGLTASAMATFMVNGSEERPYFCDNSGYAYRADYGLNDSPLNTKTSINAYYYTNWKHFDDICDKKEVPHVYITHKNDTGTSMDFSYSYDFSTQDQYTSTFPAFTAETVTSLTTRRDLLGRGRFIRFKVANNNTDTTFRVDGLGTYVSREEKTA